MAKVATGNQDEALDLVQDAMFTLVKKYSDKPESEWPMLFYRILQNRIRDWYRRQKVKSRLFSWLNSSQADDDDEEDLVDKQPDNAPGLIKALSNERFAEALQTALQELPLRQQQVFLLRAWEGLDVKQTAEAMGISDGSVKTHYSRATQALQKKLGDFHHVE